MGRNAILVHRMLDKLIDECTLFAASIHLYPDDVYIFIYICIRIRIYVYILKVLELDFRISWLDVFLLLLRQKKITLSIAIVIECVHTIAERPTLYPFYSSCHWARSESHPGQVASLSQGLHTDTHNHIHSHI